MIKVGDTCMLSYDSYRPRRVRVVCLRDPATSSIIVEFLDDRPDWLGHGAYNFRPGKNIGFWYVSRPDLLTKIPDPRSAFELSVQSYIDQELCR